MDARIDPAAAFGIELGDAHVIRNVRYHLTPDSATLSLPSEQYRSCMRANERKYLTRATHL